QYDAQGWHRTGTTVDAQSAAWLADQVRTLGPTPALEPFTLSRIDPTDAFVEVGAHREHGVPQFDARLTDAMGVRGRLGLLGTDAEIGVAGLSAEGESPASLLEARTASHHQAIVLVARGPAPGAAPANATRFPQQFGPPLLHVSSAAREWLAQEASAGAMARVVATARRAQAQAFNVVAELEGRQSELSPVVVLTPRSGWWHCAGERGGGLICWLAAMRGLSAAPGPRRVLFVATSGHELGHHGLKAFLARRPHLAAGAHAWVHFGANIGAVGQATRLLTASDAHLRDLAGAIVCRPGGPEVTVRPVAAPPVGEAQNIARDGGRFISIVGGGNPHFHLLSDRWPATVETAAVAGVARRAAELCVALAAETVGALSSRR
ncbi:MAG: hypothetical protein ACRDJ9_13245, partial [Dehalococcoidia bacterium]